MELQLIITLIELIVKHGVPLAIKIFCTLSDKDPVTLEDLQKLKEIVPDARTYFPDIYGVDSDELEENLDDI